jgi:hypothetical protein
MVCLKLSGSIEALRSVGGATVELNADCPAQKTPVHLFCQVEDITALDAVALSQSGVADSERGRLAEVHAKAEAVALTAEAMQTASTCAEAKDWEGAKKQMERAVHAISVFGVEEKQKEIAEIRAMVAKNDRTLKNLIYATHPAWAVKWLYR